MPNFFTENEDMLFQFENLNMEEIVDLTERLIMQDQRNITMRRLIMRMRLENYRSVLEIVGDIAGNFIAPRAVWCR